MRPISIQTPAGNEVETSVFGISVGWTNIESITSTYNAKN